MVGPRIQGKIDQMLEEFHEKAGLDNEGKIENEEEI